MQAHTAGAGLLSRVKGSDTQSMGDELDYQREETARLLGFRRLVL